MAFLGTTLVIVAIGGCVALGVGILTNEIRSYWKEKKDGTWKPPAKVDQGLFVEAMAIQF